jgi:6-phosphofructokinase 1
VADDGIADFTPDDASIPVDPIGDVRGPRFELGGARQMIYFSGKDVTAGIITCGGLCPGMNNVIRGIVYGLWYGYSVRRILGFRFGYLGLARDSPYPPLTLGPESVNEIHLQGGTILGSSRGAQPVDQVIDSLVAERVDLLFCIGGDGTMRGAYALYQEIAARGLQISVIGVPKTIDNDLALNERSFGFDTAVTLATEVIRAAHVEAA